jgi:DNA ligase-1
MVNMQNITSLASLYKRDTKGKLRIWTIEYGFDSEDVAGIRTISGLVDGQKITGEWNISVAKNTGRSNATTSKTQAMAEAQSEWTKKADKEYFENVKDVDSYELFKPMLAHDFTKTPVDSGYTQPKLDGIRCVVDKNGMHTRGGKPINSCPHIWESVKHIIEANPDIVLDGELYNHELKADFQKIVSLVRKVKCRPEEIAESSEKVEYHIYDMFDKNNTSMTFTTRSKWLADNVAGNKIVLVSTDKADTSADIDRLYGEYTQAGYEGQMIRQDAQYECKRSKTLLKRKEFITEEYDIVSIEQGQGNWTGYAKKFNLAMKDGRTFSSGVRGSQTQLKALWESTEKPTWVTCRYFELSNDGIPRFPVVIDYGSGKRDD